MSVASMAALIIYVIEVLGGFGMGLELVFALLSPVLFVALGRKLLVLTEKPLWASVIGPAVVSLAFSAAAFMLGHISLDELLIIMLPFVVIMPPLSMWIGLLTKRNRLKTKS